MRPRRGRVRRDPLGRSIPVVVLWLGETILKPHAPARHLLVGVRAMPDAAPIVLGDEGKVREQIERSAHADRGETAVDPEAEQERSANGREATSRGAEYSS